MVTKVTDSVMDLSDVQQDIALNGKKVIGVTPTPTLDDEVTSKKYVDDTIAALISLQVPAGMGPLPWSGATAPPGWLLCDGSAVSRTTYAALFSEIGTVYGVGDGSTTFNLPDVQGRFPLGKNTSGSGVNRVNRTQAQNLGQVSGQENYALQTGEGPNHIHSLTINTGGTHPHTGVTAAPAGSHSHFFTHNPVSVDGDGNAPFPSELFGGSTKTTNTEPDHSHIITVPSNSSSHSHTGSIGSTPAASAHENTPPFLTVNYIIKT